MMKRQHKVEVQHAKKKAIQMGEEMLTLKLNACRKAYEEEFEILARQYEEMKVEVDNKRKNESNLVSILSQQETQLTELNCTIGIAGREMIKAEQEKVIQGDIEGEDQEKLVQWVIDIQDAPELAKDELHETVQQADLLLSQPFDFYGFGIALNSEHQIDIANRAYIRFYKKKIQDVLLEKEILENQNADINKQIKGFERILEQNTRKIQELEIKEKMVMEERVTLKLEADRRIKKMSQEYVQLYKSLHEEFEKYKEFISFELEGHENVKTGLEKEITKRET